MGTITKTLRRIEDLAFSLIYHVKKPNFTDCNIRKEHRFYILNLKQISCKPVFKPSNLFSSNTCVNYIVTINNYTRIPAQKISSDSTLSTRKVFKILDERYTELDSSSIILCMVGLASGSICRHRRTRPLNTWFVMSRTCCSRLLGSGSSRTHISQRRTPKL